MCPKHFSDHCFHTVSGLLACQERRSTLWALSQPTLLTFKTPNFRDVVWVGACIGLLMEGLAALGLMQV